jgi:haloacetate dehalogenase
MSDGELRRHKIGDLSVLAGGEGEPVVLLHGIPGSAFAWESAGMLLAERYRLIIPDLLGFGRSDPPKGDYYMEAQAAAIGGLLAELGIRSLRL